MKKAYNGLILSALIICAGLLLPADNKKPNKYPVQNKTLPKWLEMTKTNMAVSPLQVIHGRKYNRTASVYSSPAYASRLSTANHPLIWYSVPIH